MYAIYAKGQFQGTVDTLQDVVYTLHRFPPEWDVEVFYQGRRLSPAIIEAEKLRLILKDYADNPLA